MKAYLRFEEPDPIEQWNAIESLRDRRARARRRSRWAVCIAAMAVASIALLRGDEEPSAHPVTPLGSSLARMQPRVPVPELSSRTLPQDDPTGASLRLSDGSLVRWTADTAVDLCEADAQDDCVAIDRGEARVQARPRKEGSLRVRAGRVEVRVIGTVFLVRRELLGDHDRVTVEVEEGRVEVSVGAESVQVLYAGDTWSLASKTRERIPARTQANRLWEAARDHGRRGEHREAAAAYQAFLDRHRGDDRAALASLELGRLRMDALGDAAGAIAPLRVAAKHRGPTQADAQARLVRALAAAKRADECRRERARYLREFPAGVHRRSIEQACAIDADHADHE